MTSFPDSLYLVSYYLLIQSKAPKALIKEIKANNSQNVQFYDPSLTDKGVGQGVNLTVFLDSLYMISYYLPIQPKALKANIKELKAKTSTNLRFYDPSVTHEKGPGVNKRYKSPENKMCEFMTTVCGGEVVNLVVNLISLLDSLYVVSYYLPISFKSKK